MVVAAAIACAFTMLALCYVNRQIKLQQLSKWADQDSSSTPKNNPAKRQLKGLGTAQQAEWQPQPCASTEPAHGSDPTSGAMPPSMPPRPETTKVPHHYRADIDGLRTLAVGFVVVFHYYPQALPGGFVGVDMFFVISGYLISGIIARQAAKGTFTYAEFYSKRIRRIFPTLVVALVTVLLFGSFLLSRRLFIETSATAAWACGFGANLRFEFFGTGGTQQAAQNVDETTAQSDYFSQVQRVASGDGLDGSHATVVNPLLHLWSLGVEEQFYIVWPMVVTSSIKLGSTRRECALYVALLLASFGINLLIGYSSDGTSASYYLPFTRFWELAIGALLAWVDQQGALRAWAASLSDRDRKQYSEIVAASGTCLLVLSVVLIDRTWVFPGWVAWLPTFGTSLVIGAPIVSPEGEAPRTNHIIGNKLFAFAGRLSYPLYVWHWPALMFGRLLFEVDPTSQRLPNAVLIGLIGTSIGLSLVTLYYVEEQLRTAPWPYTPHGLSFAIFIIFVASAITALR
jgi:peptidoglycan/LPS O-acetylase OafA/YrhL